MNKLKIYKNDQPSKRERYWRLHYRNLSAGASNVLDIYNWLPATKTRWRTQCREFKRIWRNTKEEISQ